MDCPLPDERAMFGQSYAILPDKIIVGAPYGRVDELIFAGRLHVYDETGNLLDTIYSPNPKVLGGYGYRIVVDDELIVVTEMQTNEQPNKLLVNGIVYVYNTDWELLHTLNGPTAERNSFGYNLALNDEYIFIGDKSSTVDGVERAGKVFIYSREGEFVDMIEPTNPVSGYSFGEGMVVQDDIIVIGEPGSDEATVDAGKVYVYHTDGTLIAELVSPEPSMRGYFGGSVAVHGDDIIVGEHGANKVYVFSKGATGGVESETEEDISTEETPLTEEKKDTVIPGYPIHVILIGIASITLIQLFIRNPHTLFFTST